MAPPAWNGVPVLSFCLRMKGVENGDFVLMGWFGRGILNGEFVLMDWLGGGAMENGWFVGAAMLGAWGVEAAFIRLVGALVSGVAASPRYG